MKKRRDQTPKLTANSSGGPAELPTFLDHIHELRRRLFWVVGAILVTSAGAYPFLDTILSVLTAPLGGQQLYYLTPIGGFSFSIKICFYVGIIVAVPIIMYHLYRYIEPLMGKQLRRSAVFYVGVSALMAAIGILFAYFVSLPGALHFLTGMDLKNIQAMLTVDSYLTFVMTYLLGAALLFQIPLVLSITNHMTPLKPSKLMKAQRFVVVGAFIIAAIISPTPDIMNQLLLAVPVIVMYQIGVLTVWLQNRSRAKKAQRQAALPVFEIKQPPQRAQPLVIRPTQQQPVVPTVAQSPASQPSAPIQRRVPVLVDGFTVTSGKKPVAVAQAPALRTLQPRPAQPIRPVVAPRAIKVPARSVDGFMLRRASHGVGSS